MASRQSDSVASTTKKVDAVNSQTQKMTINEQKPAESSVKDKKTGGFEQKQQSQETSSSSSSDQKTGKKEKRPSIVKIKKDDDEACLEWVINEEYLKELDKEAKPDEKQHRRVEAERLKMEGNDIYKRGEFTEAAKVYTTALRLLPFSYGNERAILYSNRAACFLYMDEIDEGILDCSKALEINPNYLKAIVRRAQIYEKMEKLDEALADYRKVLELEPRNPRALEACARLPDEIRDRNDKVKTEMLGKLKDLGNMILKPFGMSTDNFKVQQDPTTGSYSINLQQNK